VTLRGQVIAPILGGVRSQRLGRKPSHWTAVDRNYETLRVNMETLSKTSASSPTLPPPHEQLFVAEGSSSFYRDAVQRLRR
jgi:hypothetical protein